jgi:hypothetical protein
MIMPTKVSDGEVPLLFSFEQTEQVKLFNKRNGKVLNLLPKFNNAQYTVFNHPVMGDRQGLTVFLLGRLCAKDFSEILLLSSNGYGFAALQILRSLFEKLVDALHLHANPTEVDAFWDYYLIQLEKMGFAETANKLDPDWQTTAEKFKKKTKKGTRTQARWTETDLVQAAKKVGLGDNLREAYYLPNLFIHNSSAEVMFSLKPEPDGSLTPVDYNSPEERSMADVAFLYAFFFLLKVLELEVEHYGWTGDEAIVQDCIDEFGKRLKFQKVTNFSL